MERLELGSNDKFERFSHSLKHDAEILSIDRAIQMVSSKEQPSNADSPRFDTLQSRSNVKVERFSQTLSHSSATVSTDEGIQID
jgi:hypothetical protein